MSEDQGTKRKANDYGLAAAEKRSKVSFDFHFYFLVFLIQFHILSCCDVRACGGVLALSASCLEKKRKKKCRSCEEKQSSRPFYRQAGLELSLLGEGERGKRIKRGEKKKSRPFRNLRATAKRKNPPHLESVVSPIFLTNNISHTNIKTDQRQETMARPARRQERAPRAERDPGGRHGHLRHVQQGPRGKVRRRAARSVLRVR